MTDVADLREQINEEGRVRSRDLALEIGSELTAEPDRADPDAVLMNAFPVMDWLLGGPGTEDDRRNRRRAARRHLANLTAAAAADRDPAAWVSGLTREPFAWPGPEEFLGPVRQYYEFMAPEQVRDCSGEVRDRVADGMTDPRHVRVRELLRDRGPSGSTVARLVVQLATEGMTCPRETIYRWLRGDEVAGLVREIRQPLHCWAWVQPAAEDQASSTPPEE